MKISLNRNFIKECNKSIVIFVNCKIKILLLKYELTFYDPRNQNIYEFRVKLYISWLFDSLKSIVTTNSKFNFDYSSQWEFHNFYIKKVPL